MEGWVGCNEGALPSTCSLKQLSTTRVATTAAVATVASPTTRYIRRSHAPTCRRCSPRHERMATTCSSSACRRGRLMGLTRAPSMPWSPKKAAVKDVADTARMRGGITSGLAARRRRSTSATSAPVNPSPMYMSMSRRCGGSSMARRRPSTPSLAQDTRSPSMPSTLPSRSSCRSNTFRLKSMSSTTRTCSPWVEEDESPIERSDEKDDDSDE
mmetsp:Transcript_6408/g.20793  ORF Transcript_6408/g.20793 Transcript_6408/m.20793 type:complete len:213 (+) Transcript_6408:175-813(+)